MKRRDHKKQLIVGLIIFIALVVLSGVFGVGPLDMPMQGQ